MNPVNTQRLGAAFATTKPFWAGMFLLNRIQDTQKKTDFQINIRPNTHRQKTNRCIIKSNEEICSGLIKGIECEYCLLNKCLSFIKILVPPKLIKRNRFYKKTLHAASITHTDKTVFIQKTSLRWESGTEGRAEQLGLMRGKYLRYNEADAGTKKSKSNKTVARCISCVPVGPLREYE